MFKCYKCEELKEKSQFPPAKDKRNGVRTVCKTCTKDQARIWHNLHNYGLSQSSLEEMITAQNNCCKICQRSFTKVRRAVDHCHKTGKVRGLLCNSCNSGLGKFVDNPVFLQNAANYLLNKE